MSAPLRCPLCSASVPQASMEPHLREELAYAPFRCLLCPLRFFSFPQAQAHFRGDFATHPSVPLSVAEQRDFGVEKRLKELLWEAQGADPRPKAELVKASEEADEEPETGSRQQPPSPCPISDELAEMSAEEPQEASPQREPEEASGEPPAKRPAPFHLRSLLDASGTEDEDVLDASYPSETSAADSSQPLSARPPSSSSASGLAEESEPVFSQLLSAKPRRSPQLLGRSRRPALVNPAFFRPANLQPEAQPESPPRRSELDRLFSEVDQRLASAQMTVPGRGPAMDGELAGAKATGSGEGLDELFSSVDRELAEQKAAGPGKGLDQLSADGGGKRVAGGNLTQLFARVNEAAEPIKRAGAGQLGDAERDRWDGGWGGAAPEAAESTPQRHSKARPPRHPKTKEQRDAAQLRMTASRERRTRLGPVAGLHPAEWTANEDALRLLLCQAHQRSPLPLPLTENSYQQLLQHFVVMGREAWHGGLAAELAPFLLHLARGSPGPPRAALEQLRLLDFGVMQLWYIFRSGLRVERSKALQTFLWKAISTARHLEVLPKDYTQSWPSGGAMQRASATCADAEELLRRLETSQTSVSKTPSRAGVAAWLAAYQLLYWRHPEMDAKEVEPMRLAAALSFVRVSFIKRNIVRRP